MSGSRDATLCALVAGFAGRGDHPGLVALGDGGIETWSYGLLAAHIRRLAAGLVKAGVAHGEPVALLAPNGPEWIIAWFSIVCAGAMAVPIDNAVPDGELARVLRNSQARRIFLSEANLPRCRRAAPQGTLDVFLLGDAPQAEGARPWSSLLCEADRPLPEAAPDDVACLLYTSGTTGTPKGVPLTHRNLMSNVAALLAEPRAGPDDRVLLPLPTHHAYPLTVGVLGTLASGATLVLPSGISGPQIAEALRTAEVSIVIGVPRLYEALLAGIEARIAARGRAAALLFRTLLRLSTWLRRRLGLRVGHLLFRSLHGELAPRLRLLVCGGARLESSAAWTLEGLGWTVLSGYGLTETAPIISLEAPGKARIGTAGRPAPGVEIRIAAPDQRGHGEILVRGPNVFSGYWRDPDATRAAFAPDGWMRTGDLGFLDGDGYLHVVARANEVIVLPGGSKVFPETVEKAYATSPFIREVAVLAQGGTLVALIVPEPAAMRERGTARAEGLLRDNLEVLSLELSPHERLTGYALTQQALPRTHLGKIRRHLLPALYAQARAGAPGTAAAALSPADQTLLDRPISRAVWTWLAARFPDRALTPDTSPQLDLGIDSLEWVALTMEMEQRFGIRLTQQVLAHVFTLRDLLNEVGAAGPVEADGGTAAADLRWLAPTSLPLRLLGGVLSFVNAAAMRLAFGLRVDGSQRVPADGPVIIAPNHNSYLDPFVLAAALGRSRLDRVYWVGWTGKLFTGPMTRLFSRVAHVVPMDPDRSPAAGLALAAEVLRRGHALVWFPEGRRSPDGTVHPFLPGVGVLMERSGAPAVPVRIRGTFEALPRGRALPRPRRVTIVFGEPSDAAALAAAGQGGTRAARIADGLRQAVSALHR